MCLSWCSPRPAWWAMWTSSLSWTPTSSTFLRSRSPYWRTKHPGWAKSAVRTLLWDAFLMKAFNICTVLYTYIQAVGLFFETTMFWSRKPYCLVLQDNLFVYSKKKKSAKMNWDILCIEPLSVSESCFSCLLQRQQWTDRSLSPSPTSSMPTVRGTASHCCMTSQKTSSSWT